MPAPLKYPVNLCPQDRQKLEVIARSGRRSQREKTRARILLLADQKREEGSLSDEQIAQRLHCTPATVALVRRRAVQRGCPLATVSHARQHKRKARALAGEQEAQLVVLCCSTPPEGQHRWTLKLLRNRLIELEVVESIGCETIRRTLKKTNSSPGKRKVGASRPSRTLPSSAPWKMS